MLVLLPNAGIFFCLNMVLITLSSFLSVTVINLHIRVDKSNRVPKWLRTVRILTNCQHLSQVVCMTPV